MPDLGRGVLPDNYAEHIANMGMSPRQQALNWYWSFYKREQYENRTTDWDGGERADILDTEMIGQSGIVPPGFTARPKLPIKYRRPTAPYHLGNLITERFTSLLFSEDKHPSMGVRGDPKAEDYVQALAEAARLWSMMTSVRNHGGGMGSVCVAFMFSDGVPVLEILDARWTTPTWRNRALLDLAEVEVRYQYEVETRGAAGRLRATRIWYRRVINSTTDTVYAPVPVGEGAEPDWKEGKKSTHNFGFCPAVWICNTEPGTGSYDGEPDCAGTHDAIMEMDRQVSQALRSGIANADPLLVAATSAEELPPLSPPDGWQLPTGSTAQFLETTGKGAELCWKSAIQLRSWVLEMSQCVLEDDNSPLAQGAAPQTATEVRQRVASMHARAGVFREQYGQRGVLNLLRKMLRAVRVLEARHEEVVLAPRVETDIETGVVTHVTRLIPDAKSDALLSLQWPPYSVPTTQETLAATQAAAAALTSKLLDEEAAIAYLAPYFHVADPAALQRRLAKASAAKSNSLASPTINPLGRQLPPGEDDGVPNLAPTPDDVPPPPPPLP
jgi:hypothetical protein